jgi:signal transduction histidine kinase
MRISIVFGVVGTALALFVFFVTKTTIDTATNDGFERIVDELFVALNDHFTSCTIGIRDTGILFTLGAVDVVNCTSPCLSAALETTLNGSTRTSVSYDAFKTIVGRVISLDESIVSFYWAPRIESDDQRALWTDLVQQQFFPAPDSPNTHFHDFDNTTVPTNSAPYFPVVYAYPTNVLNKVLIDFSSNSDYADAMAFAASTQSLVVVQSVDFDSALKGVAFQPVFFNSADQNSCPSSCTNSRSLNKCLCDSNLVGFVIATIDLEYIAQQVMDPVVDHYPELWLSFIESTTNLTIYSSSSRVNTAANTKALHQNTLYADGAEFLNQTPLSRAQQLKDPLDENARADSSVRVYDAQVDVLTSSSSEESSSDPEPPARQSWWATRFHVTNIDFAHRIFELTVLELNPLTEGYQRSQPFFNLAITILFVVVASMGVWVWSDWARRHEKLLEATVMTLKDFTALTTHELRTPVSTFEFAIQLLEATNLSAEQQLLVQNQRVARIMMQQIIDNVLTYERIASGKVDTLKPDIVHVDVVGLVERVVDVTCMFHHNSSSGVQLNTHFAEMERSDRSQQFTLEDMKRHTTRCMVVHSDEKWLQQVCLCSITYFSTKKKEEGKYILSHV